MFIEHRAPFAPVIVKRTSCKLRWILPEILIACRGFSWAATSVSDRYLYKLSCRLRSLTHMGQYQLSSVLAVRLSPLNIDHTRNLPVEICGINYTEKYTNLYINY